MANAKTYDPDELRAILAHASANQRPHIEAVIQHGSARKAALASGCNKGAVIQAIDRARRASELAITRTELDTSGAYATTTLYRDPTPDSDTPLQWVKRKKSDEDRIEALRHAVDTLNNDIKPVRPVKFKGPKMDRLMSLYPLADPHIGLYSWAAENGEEWNTDKAEETLNRAIDYLVDWSLPSKRGVLMGLGDLFHTENMDGTTSKSGHILDMSGRFPNHIEVGLRVLTRAINRMLHKHETVEGIFVPGNHDETMAHAIRSMFHLLYANDPRVIIHNSPAERQYLEHGRVLLGAVHGHKTKDDKLPGIMATERPEAWGRTRHRYFFRGHHHHDSRVEYNGCIVEQVRCPVPGDSYSVSHGFLSKPDMKCIVFDKKRGEGPRNAFGSGIFYDGDDGF